MRDSSQVHSFQLVARLPHELDVCLNVSVLRFFDVLALFTSEFELPRDARSFEQHRPNAFIRVDIEACEPVELTMTSSLAVSRLVILEWLRRGKNGLLLTHLSRREQLGGERPR